DRVATRRESRAQGARYPSPTGPRATRAGQECCQQRCGSGVVPQAPASLAGAFGNSGNDHHGGHHGQETKGDAEGGERAVRGRGGGGQGAGGAAKRAARAAAAEAKAAAKKPGMGRPGDGRKNVFGIAASAAKVTAVSRALMCRLGGALCQTERECM